MSKCLIALGLTSFCLTAQATHHTKFDTGSTLELLRYSAAEKERTAECRSRNARDTDLMVTVTLNQGYSAEDLVSANLELAAKIGEDMCIVRGPVNLIVALENHVAVKSLSLGDRLNVNLDTARDYSAVDFVHQGLDLPGQYTGRGVICGTFDTGVDPNHLNFYNSASDETRVKAVFHYLGSSGSVKQYTMPEEIALFTTDNESTSHGTHTLGIMTGSFADLCGDNQGTFAVLDPNSNRPTVLSQGKHPYYGIAPGADIAVACGDAYETNVLAGLSQIVEYAKSVNQPVVINLSMGQLIGPHDGSDSFSRGLERIGCDAILCVSAGNDGQNDVSIVKQLTDDDRCLKTFIKSDMMSAGTLDLWSSERDSLKFELVIGNTATGKILYSLPLSANETKRLSTSDMNPVSITDEDFDCYFTASEISLASSENTATNNRYNVRLNFNLERKGINNPEIAVGIIAEGKPGNRLDLVGKNTLVPVSLKSYDLPGWSDSNSDLSVNSTACGKNVVVVGAYSTKGSWAALDSKIYENTPSLSAGHIAGFSGYGITADGRSLPHVVAPGVSIVSSLNSFNRDSNAMSLVSNIRYGGREHHWGVQSGVSMSTPVVSGIVATWLEYDPDLSADDVRDIIERTARRDSFCLEENPVKVGAGKIDAYSGLKEVIRRSAVADISVAAGPIFKWIDSKRLEIYSPSGVSEVDVYSLTGQIIKQITGHGDTLECDLSSLTPGIYIIQINKTSSQRISI